MQGLFHIKFFWTSNLFEIFGNTNKSDIILRKKAGLCRDYGQIQPSKLRLNLFWSGVDLNFINFSMFVIRHLDVWGCDSDFQCKNAKPGRGLICFNNYFVSIYGNDWGRCSLKKNLINKIFFKRKDHYIINFPSNIKCVVFIAMLWRPLLCIYGDSLSS